MTENEVRMGIEGANLQVRRQVKAFREEINCETNRRALDHEGVWQKIGTSTG